MERQRMRWLTIDQVVGSVFAAFSLLVLWETRKIPLGFMAEPGPGAVPALLAAVLLACSIAVVIGGHSGKRAADVQWTEAGHAAAVLGTCAFVALTMERLGYRLTILIALLVLVRVVERKGWIAAVLFAVCFSFGTYYLFDTLLRVPLPQGPFGF
jgi:putative tricarboxylic transport membrane protein